jgi:hypothetical protein
LAKVSIAWAMADMVEVREIMGKSSEFGVLSLEFGVWLDSLRSPARRR